MSRVKSPLNRPGETFVAGLGNTMVRPAQDNCPCLVNVLIETNLPVRIDRLEIPDEICGNFFIWSISHQDVDKVTSVHGAGQRTEWLGLGSVPASLFSDRFMKPFVKYLDPFPGKKGCMKWLTIEVFNVTSEPKAFRGAWVGTYLEQED